MTKKLFALSALALAAAPAHAAEISLTGEFDYTAYSEQMGNRVVGSAWTSFDLGPTTVVAKGSAGERDFGAESFSGVEGELTVYRDWNDMLSTRTSASLSSDDVVFAKHSIEHDFNLKLLPKTVFLAGIKHVEYNGDIDALVLSGGVTRYFKGGFISYRFSRYDLDDMGNTRSHTASVRVNDGKGSKGFTQLWVSRGTALQEVDFAATVFKGHTTGIALRRVQPLGGKASLNMTLGHNWFETEFNDYTGLTAKGGLTLGF